MTTITRSDTARDITRSEFFGKDFDTYRQEIIDNITNIFGNEVASNIVMSEQGVMLIEIISFALSTLSWYGDRQADDTNLQDARVRTNAVAIARQLGYKPSGAVPAVVELTMTLDAPAPARVTIEKGRKLQGPNGLVFETIDETIFETGESGPKTFLIREGQTFEELFTSDGQPNQRFFLETVPDGQTIAEDTIETRVSGVIWPVEPFLTFEQSNISEAEIGRDPPFVRFGDGVAGNIPPVDTEVRITYFATSGPNGAVTSNTVTSFLTQLLAADSSAVNPTLVHNEPSTPGSFRESIDSIKVNAPLVFQSAQRAVTIRDLDGLINSFVDPTFGSVAIGRATTPRSAEEDAELQTHIRRLEDNNFPQAFIDEISDYWDKVLNSNCRANIILAQILAADSIGRYVTASVDLARALEEFLDTKVESTAKVRVIDGSVSLFSVDVSVEVKVLPEIDTEIQRVAVKDSVQTSVQDFLLGRSFGESFRVSDLYNILDNLDGVDYVNVQITEVLNIGVSALNRVDTFGNLAVGEFEVITLGELPIVTLI